MLLICGRERPIRRGQLVVGAAEVLQHLLVGRRLLERVELRAVQVLQQRVAEHVVVVGLADDRRDRLEAGLLGGAPAALAHDQLVGLDPGAPHDDRLEQPDLADRVDQLGHGVLVEDLARLHAVGRDLVERDLGEVGAGDRRQAVLGPTGVRGVGRRRRRSPSSRRRRRARGRLRAACRAAGSVPSVAPSAGGRRSGGDQRAQAAAESSSLRVAVLAFIVGLPWWRSRGRPRGSTARPAIRDRRSSRSGRTTAPPRPAPSAGSWS